MAQLQELLDRIWEDYARVNPQARAIVDLLASRGESIVNDHIAFRTNHFTVLVNTLKSIPSLEALSDLLKDNGFALNSGGGEIKGSADVFLKQSSTLASEISVQFTDGTYMIPGCYYEFARRYPMSDGRLFQGFVTRSADHISRARTSDLERCRGHQ